ncbi:MAG TPA: NAD(P)H-hydrate dehydratase [Candidatus Binatia bacterium]|nr:NAD(P)H-hydrate dehydratase [Candidatus Binatia bacterium]
MKIVGAEEMREIDRVTSEKFGVHSLVLMENAGAAVAERVLAMLDESADTPAARTGAGAPRTKASGATLRILVICGKGNNGGDGFVVTRLLHEKGKSVEVVLLADPAELRGDAALMYGKLPKPAIIVRSSEELKSDRVRQLFAADIFVDAILGTGFKPPVRGLYAEAITLLNAANGKAVAVDIPSGADADAMGLQQGTIARADAILTFTAARPAHVFSLLTDGPTCVAPIGSPDEAIVSSLRLNAIHPRDFESFVALRPPESNKGNYGHVLVIGGSLGKAGAAAMAGMSALRAGAGLSTVATAKSVLSTVAGFHAELMTEPLEETAAGTIATSAGVRLEELLKTMTVVAIGPGISRDPHTATLVRSLIAHHTIPMVVDADGLNAFEHHTGELNGKGRTLVITPHPGEMARLAGCSTADVQKDRLGVARKFASDHELIVVLKGHRTLVVQPDGEAWVNVTGNPGMATGGTGDILTGMVAAMIAQHPKDLLMAACAAVYLHGLAGDVARESMGEHSLVASDLLRGLPEAFERARQSATGHSACWNSYTETSS